MSETTLTDETILKYMPLVKIIAIKIKNYYLNDFELEDLISFGLFGLIDAIMKYDLNKSDFKTYASIRIRGSIIDGMRKYGKMSRDDTKLIIRMEQLKEKYNNYLSLEQLSDLLGISVNRIKELEKYSQINNAISIESIEQDYGFLDDTLDKIELYELSEELLKICSELSKQQKRFVYLYYIKQFKIKEIAEILKISSSSVSQLKNKTLKKLRKEENLERLKDYY